MMYVKNGGMIRMVTEDALPGFLQRGFVPLSPVGVQPPKKPARRHKEGKPHDA